MKVNELENFKEILIELTRKRGMKIENIAALIDADKNILKNESRHSELKFYQIGNFIRTFDVEPNSLFLDGEADTTNVSIKELDCLRGQINDLNNQIQALTNTINKLLSS